MNSWRISLRKRGVLRRVHHQHHLVAAEARSAWSSGSWIMIVGSDEKAWKVAVDVIDVLVARDRPVARAVRLFLEVHRIVGAQPVILRVRMTVRETVGIPEIDLHLPSPRRLAVHDLVEIFAQAVTRQAVALVFRHAFGDAGVELLAVRRLAAVAQGNQRQHLAAHFIARAGFRLHLGAQGGLVPVLVPVGVDGAFGDQVVLAVLEHHAALARLAFGAGHDGEHHAEVAAEIHRTPAIPVDRLPVARPPALVAQAEAFDRETFRRRW